MIDGALAVFDRSGAKLLEGFGRGRDCFVDVVKHAVAAACAAPVRRMRAWAKLLEHLFDNAFDDLFGSLHAEGSGFRFQVSVTAGGPRRLWQNSALIHAW